MEAAVEFLKQFLCYFIVGISAGMIGAGILSFLDWLKNKFK